jgi:hypothetical protein
MIKSMCDPQEAEGLSASLPASLPVSLSLCIPLSLPLSHVSPSLAPTLSRLPYPPSPSRYRVRPLLTVMFCDIPMLVKTAANSIT